ncbi:peptidase inhibitor family I36 protein [Hamadaea sp. NPDC051192]|uniref:peptidase inhibitor family I36 protein n=1 Tax=Hamadaea sp. NPDC051192 TaxID=3154940 RepID=UPI00342ECF8D
MRKTIVAGVITAFLASFAVATPAQAGDVIVVPRSCPAGYFCAYQLADFDGLMWKWAGDDSNWGNNYSGGLSASNRATSVFNNGTPCYKCDHVIVFDEAGYEGYLGWFAPGEAVWNLPDYQDNKIEAHEWGGAVG